MPKSVMQHSKALSTYGYTLMELLIVITILITLSGLTIHGLRGAMRKAYITESRIELLQLVTALEGYYNDNGVYPDIIGSGASYDAQKDGDQGVVTDGRTNGGQELIKLLIKERHGGAYLTAAPAKTADDAGVHVSSYSYRDHWGSPYEVYWDANYDGLLTNPLDPETTLTKGVVAIGRGGAFSFTQAGQVIVKSW